MNTLEITTVNGESRQVSVGDTVKYRIANGSVSLFRVAEILKPRPTNVLHPPGFGHIFVGDKGHFSGKKKFCYESQITDIVTRSVDNPEDWIDEKFVPEKN